MTKKILIIGMTSNQGGVETFVINLISNLTKKQDYEFYILDTTGMGIAYKDEFLNLGVKIIKKDYPKGRLAIFRRNLLAKSIFQQNKFDIVHIQANNLNTVYWAKHALKFNVEKVIFHSHNSMLGSVPKIKKQVLKILMPFQKNFLRINDKKILKYAASEESGRWMFGNNEFTVIPNGVKTSDYLLALDNRELIRNKENVNDCKVITLVARFSEQKNHNRLLSIFRDLILYSDENYMLWLVGDGEYFENIFEKVSTDVVLKDKIKFFGSRKDIADILAATDLFIMPSLYEGLPFSIVEAQASGLPCVVSSEAFNAESNIINKFEYVSLSDNNEAWIFAVHKMLKDEKASHDLYIDERKKRNFVVSESKFAVDYGINLVENSYR